MRSLSLQRFSAVAPARVVSHRLDAHTFYHRASGSLVRSCYHRTAADYFLCVKSIAKRSTTLLLQPITNILTYLSFGTSSIEQIPSTYCNVSFTLVLVRQCATKVASRSRNTVRGASD